MVLLIPVNSYITSKIRIITHRLMKHKDKRIKLINEILSGIKVLKLYAWESSFDAQVTKHRNDEIKELTLRAILEGAMVYVFNSAPFLVCPAHLVSKVFNFLVLWLGGYLQLYHIHLG